MPPPLRCELHVRKSRFDYLDIEPKSGVPWRARTSSLAVNGSEVVASCSSSSSVQRVVVLLPVGGSTSTGPNMMARRAAGAVLVFTLAFPHASASSLPNLIFLMSDQHRDDAFTGGRFPTLTTPNFDRLFDEGVRFSTHYTSVRVTPLRTTGRSEADRSHSHIRMCTPGPFLHPCTRWYPHRPDTVEARTDR